ncbi:MAG: hypothetical protein PHI12_14225 [Dehalococcoidales bacterium]|nr:hypothetical protein [Dehalococcoidales bacterium]
MANRFCQHGLATGSNNGTSWEDAYQSIYTAVSSAVAGDSVYIKEHAGIDISSSGEVTFAKKLLLYGGCDASLTGVQTEPRTGLTVLDGNLADVRGIRLSAGAGSEISRFMVMDTRCTGNGGAFYVDVNWASPYYVIIRDCFMDNCHAVNGGAVYATQSSVYFVNTHTENCYASGSGGAIYANDAGVVIGILSAATLGPTYPCTFIGNHAVGNGGAICIGPSTTDVCTIVKSSLIGNISDSSGGAIWLRCRGVASRISNCLIAGNYAAHIGGVYFYPASDSGRIVFCTVVGNEATVGNVGGIEVAGIMNLNSSIVRGNIGVASNIQCNAFGEAKINNCDIQDKDTTGVVPFTSLGTGNVDVDPVFLGSGSHPYDLTGDTPYAVARGGNSSSGYFDVTDIILRDRSLSVPSMGAYERIGAEPSLLAASHFAMQGAM